ncbi:MAG: TonB-dependent receptor [Bacteroidales bacterium]|nr:TonB-dependent receptor [Bacteroidales bacterium]
MRKIISSLFSITALVVTLAFTTQVSAQNQQLKSFNVENATLEECLKLIEKQSGIGYLAKEEEIKSVKGITYSATNKDLQSILEAILSKTGYTFQIKNSVILIMKERVSQPSGQKQEERQKWTLSLKIVDSGDKIPIIGATALIKEYGIYGMSDLNGSALLKNLPSGQVTIEVQMLGYEQYKRVININNDSDITINLHQTSLELDEVVVTATRSAAGTSTSSKIGRQAMDHLQATSLKDIMQLIPGQLLTGAGNMTSAEKITIRTLNTFNANNAFGTSILVDGVPISDNASLSDKTAISSTGGTGVDLRQIGADNIESVEVIRGIPSAEYGDLASGAVIVNTKAGYTPYEVRTKINPVNFNTSLGKGWNFGKSRGSMNANIDYAQAWGDPRQKTTSFDRLSGGITYTRTIGKIWYTNTKVSFSNLLDFRGTDPDVLIEGTENTQKSFSLRLSHNGRFSINAPLMRTLSYSLGYSESLNESRNSTIVSAGGGLPIITSLTPGYYEVPYITDSYRTSGGTIGKPRSFFAKVSNAFFFNVENFHQRFNMGVEYRLEENRAKGFYNDDDNRPLRPNSNGRPRPYFDIPRINQVSAYFEDNINWMFGDGLGFKLQAGVRFDMLQPGQAEQVSSISPRFNASLKLTDWLEFRGGWGRNSKTPGLSHLYPEPNYTDRESARYLPSAVMNQIVMYNTYITYVERNNMLKNATNTKTEIGADIKLPNEMTFSLVAYRDYMANGFGNFTEYQTFFSNYYTANQGMIINPGQKPLIDWKNPARVDTVFTTTGRVGNTQASLDKGVEFDFYFGQIKPIRTSLYLSGALMETSSWSSGPSFSNPNGIPSNSVYGQGGANTPPFKLEYPSGVTKSIQRRFSTVLRAVCNIPQLRMVASLSGQVIWYSYSTTTNQKSAPIGWLDTDLSYHKITQSMLDDPNYKIKGISLIDQIRDPRDTDPITMPPLWIMNARLTKDISKSLGFSFFVSNLFFYTPYQSSSASGTLIERNTGTFSFGMELFVKI